MIKSIYFMFFVCACLFGLFACSAKAQDKFKNLSSDDFEKLIQDEDIQRVDVRTVAEYSQGHIPGSLNINVLDEKFAAEADELLDKERPVAVYCKSGRRSRNAARILTKKDLRFTTWIKDSKTGRNLVKTSNSKKYTCGHLRGNSEVSTKCPHVFYDKNRITSTTEAYVSIQQ